MQPRSLQQVLTELDSTYNPQIESIRQRQAAIPGQMQAEEQGLQAKQTQAYDDILGGARRRGMGFSGIPLGEQAKYSATEYMPALARLKQSGREQAMSLEDAINGIYEKRNNFGYQIKQNEDQLFESRRQFDTQQAFAKEQEANRLREAARASAASAMPTNGLLGGQPANADPYASLGGRKQEAANAMVGLFKTNNPGTIKNTIAAIQASAAKGNQYDKYKLELLGMYQQNSPYASIIQKSLAYKPAPSYISQPVAGKSNVNITFPGQVAGNGHPNISIGR